MKTVIIENVEQIDPTLGEDGLTVGFYGWTDDDETYFWSISLPMKIEEDAFEDMLTEWRELGWLQLMRQD
ncbi:hypothetical protein [Rhizobium giardinii]|uniref:hypothetical protein n=1 Tax=Rhizobium giardinii TaxID=56731 RepID=UPI003D6E3A2A